MAKEINSAIAARELSDEISDIKTNLERALAMMQELTDEYFATYDPLDKEDYQKIVYDFARFGIYAGIAEDYLFRVRKVIDALREMPKVHTPVIEEVKSA